MSSSSSSQKPTLEVPQIRLSSSSASEHLDQGESKDSLHPCTLRPPRRPPPPPPLRQAGQKHPLPLHSTGRPLYSFNSDERSTELLLPPRHLSRRCYCNDYPVRSATLSNSPFQSPFESRRSSIDSGALTHASVRFQPYADSHQASSRLPSEDGNLNTQTVSEKYNISPSAVFLLFPEDIEKDDWLHNPVPGEEEPRGCDTLSRRGFLNISGLLLITLGALMLFIGYPIATFVENTIFLHRTACMEDPSCIRSDLPLLQNVRQGLIDPDTPESVKTRTARDGSTQNLVFSDEFNTPGRSFYEKDDAYFQAVDLWYGSTFDLEWYDPDAITTADGVLTIEFNEFQNHGLDYRSGMLQSWNQLCFKGGYIEASISLPGNGQTSGFWPGFWTMGNLGRPGYEATTDGLWPYSYWNKCDYGITANQSSTDGLNFLPGMRLPACTCDRQTHPSPGKSRSAPEIDALEASVGFIDIPSEAAIGTVSQSFQVAPFDIWYQPNYDFVELYDSSITTMNTYRGSSFQQAISGLTNLNNDWYDGKAYQTYGFEYSPGADAYTTWFVGKDSTWMLDERAIGPNGNVGQRILSEEPMAIVANLGLSMNFAPINWTGLARLFPATMRVDYIRIYQGSDGVVTCDPEGYPTTEYIAQHPRAYENAQKTTWASAGYKWPKNSFVDQCDAAKRTTPVP